MRCKNCLMRTVRRMVINLLLYLLKGGDEPVKAIIAIYSALIIEGDIVICDVPKSIREDVRGQLRQLGLSHLADVQCADEPQ